tara:strand:- start:81 stop:317 length:237 start_codon:yes stop_codon:yes gene_type:complete
MDKIFKAMTVVSFATSSLVVGVAGYTYFNRTAIIDSVKDRAAEELSNILPGLVKGSLPAVPSVPAQTGPANFPTPPAQ